jgi:alanine-alpha-ketoisovalerate/valine-pyruvate aminotransferase
MEQIEAKIININYLIKQINDNENDFTYKNILEFVKINNKDTSVKSVLSESPINPKDKILSNSEINKLDDGYETDNETISELIQVEPIELNSAFYDINNKSDTISELL